MAIEYRAICKDCNQEFGYSNESLESGSTRGLSRPERCPKCRRTHSREGRSIGIPQIKVKPTGPRRPDKELSPGRLGKISHPERPHKRVTVESKFGRPDSSIEFGITDDDIRRLIKTMRHYQVTVVVGPTGSGKSTFLPYRLMVPPEGIEPDIFTRYGQIVVTQPRIQATRNIARFVAQDLHGSSLGAGFDVGFRHSNAPASDWRNKLVYITDGTLINWIVSGQISNLSIIMIDEAHERSLNIDLILGLLKQQLPRFPDLKLIIASATINAELFQGYFGGPDKAALIQFRGLKQHRVDAFFPFHDYMLRNDRKVPEHMAEKIRKILIDIKEGEKSEGDVLGFLQGEGAIGDCIESLRQKVMETPELRNEDINIYPLYSGLSQAEQDLALKKKTLSIRDKVLKYIHHYTPRMPDRIIALLLDQKSAEETRELVQKGIEEAEIKGWAAVLLDHDKNDFNKFPGQILFTTHEAFSEMKNTAEFHVIADRRVIISTNLAETSLTVDGIVYVVDSGLIKEAHWYAKNSARDLVSVFHSRAGCRQRWGRAGRVRAGEVYMLYTDSQFEDEGVFPAHTLPEIQRSSLEEVILKSKAAGVDDIEKFDWIQKPPLDELERAPAVLKKMGALDAEGDLTGYGAELQSFASDVPVASLLVSADQYACGLEMATFAAMSQARAKGGFLSWDKRWDSATRHYVERIHKQFSEACLDDMEFFLKIYSLWAETMDSEVRLKVCELFFINEEEISSKVALVRNKFMEMLSVAKKVEEDRAISFASLDRLRILLAITLPEKFIYKTDKDGLISVYNENSGSIPFKIDEGSVLAEKPPSFFLAMSRWISKTKEDEQQLLLSGLVRLKPEWIKYREYSTIRLAAAIAEMLKPKRAMENLGRERYRLFLDVLYPVGARYRLLENNTEGPVPGEKISDPEPVQIVFAEGAIKSADFLMPDAEKDVDPLAGWEDKQDRHVSYDPQEGILDTGDISGHNEVFITEEEHDSKENISDNNETAHIPEMITTYGNSLIPVAEIRAAREIIPIFMWGSRTGGGEACEIAGHDFSDIAKPKVILKDSSVEQQDSTPDVSLEPGGKVRVKGIGLVELSNNEKALLVRKIEANEEFIVDAKDLTFSERWNLCEEFLDREFDMVVEQRRGGLRLSMLPLIEKSLQDFLKSAYGSITCRLIEQRGRHLNFVIEDLAEKGIIEGAYMGKYPGDKTEYEVGKTYSLFLDGNYGIKHETVAPPPEGLEKLIEEEKLRHKLFWNNWQGRLHVNKPMDSDIKEKLFNLTDSQEFHSSIARLYRHSNSVRVKAQKSKPPLETGEQARRQEYLNDDIPEYKRGEKVTGRISAIFDNNVKVALDRGGSGNVSLSYLSWKRIIDPREVVYADQKVEVSIVGQRFDEKKGKILIDLSLLDKEDFPIDKYYKGSVHKAKVVILRDYYALAELEAGLTGFIDKSAIQHELVENISDHLNLNQMINVRIISLKINPIDPKRPLSIKLSIKEAFSRALPIPKEKIGLLLGKNGSTIQELKRKTQCGIWFDTKKRIIEITSSSEDKIENAVKLINELLSRDKGKFQPDWEGRRRQYPGQKKDYVSELKIPVGKIGLLVGKGGSMVRQIKEKSESLIQIEKSGAVHIMSRNEKNINRAIELISNLIPETRHIS